MPQNYTKAIRLYKKVITQGAENNFYIAHAYFNLGVMANLGLGFEKNSTRALKYYNSSTEHEPNAYYPAILMRYYNVFESSNIFVVILNYIQNSVANVFKLGVHTIVISMMTIGYITFFYSIFSQKD